MRKAITIGMMLLGVVCAQATVVFTDNMDDLSVWRADSTAMNNNSVQEGWGDGWAILMDSWGAGPGWTMLRRSTGVVIEAGYMYEVLVGAQLHVEAVEGEPAGKPADFRLYAGAVGNNSQFALKSITGDAVWPALEGVPYNTYTLSFDTLGGNNVALVGETLEIGMFGGWWNSSSYDDVTITAVVPEPATLALLGFGALTLLKRKR